MKGLLVAVGLVILGAICWAKFGDKITSEVNNKITEMQASFSNSLQSLTTPRK